MSHSSHQGVGSVRGGKIKVKKSESHAGLFHLWIRLGIPASLSNAECVCVCDQIQTVKTQEMNLLRDQNMALNAELQQRRTEQESFMAQKDDLNSQLQVYTHPYSYIVSSTPTSTNMSLQPPWNPVTLEPCQVVVHFTCDTTPSVVICSLPLLIGKTSLTSHYRRCYSPWCSLPWFIAPRLRPPASCCFFKVSLCYLSECTSLCDWYDTTSCIPVTALVSVNRAVINLQLHCIEAVRQATSSSFTSILDSLLLADV